MTTTPISKLEAHEFASALMLMKHRAGQLGFFKTMHALEPATQAIGWEMAENIEVVHKTAAKDKAARAAARSHFRSPQVSEGQS